MEARRCTKQNTRSTRWTNRTTSPLTCPVPRRRTLTPTPPRTSCRAVECRRRRSSKAAARSCPSRPPLCPYSARTPGIASWCWTEAWKPLPRKSAPCCAVRTFGTGVVGKNTMGGVRIAQTCWYTSGIGGSLEYCTCGPSLEFSKSFRTAGSSLL